MIEPSACGIPAVVIILRFCMVMLIVCGRLLLHPMVRSWPAAVKMKQCASGMRIWASASRSYEDIHTWFAASLSMLMAVFLPVLAMIKQYAYGMLVRVSASRPYKGIMILYGRLLSALTAKF